MKFGQKKYDVIEADAITPKSAYSGNLYSREYFTLAKERLKAGGMMVSWGPTPRTTRTFKKVFPYVLDFSGVLVGSNDPILFDVKAVRALFNEPRTREHYKKMGFDMRVIELVLFGQSPEAFTPGDDRSGLTDINTDLYPKDEYLVPERRR